MTIGERIRFFRRTNSLTQKQLGELCVPPMADSAIRRYESGRQIPKPETLERIAKALDVSIGDLDSRYLDDNELCKRLTNCHHSLEDLKIKSYYNGSDESVIIDFLQDQETDLMNEVEYRVNTPEHKALIELLDYFDKLNLSGKTKAIEQIKLLAEIPKFCIAQDSSTESD